MWSPQNKISLTGIILDLPVPTLCFQWSLLDPDVSFDTGTDLDPAKLNITDPYTWKRYRSGGPAGREAGNRRREMDEWWGVSVAKLT